MKPKHEQITRRQLAALLDLHQDSVTRALPDGLAYADLKWGGAGREMVFSRQLAERWANARECRRDRGRPCYSCRVVLEDARYTAEHLLLERHGHGGCAECCGGHWMFEPLRHGSPWRANSETTSDRV